MSNTATVSAVIKAPETIDPKRPSDLFVKFANSKIGRLTDNESYGECQRQFAGWFHNGPPEYRAAQYKILPAQGSSWTYGSETSVKIVEGAFA